MGIFVGPATREWWLKAKARGPIAVCGTIAIS
jgi:hypothetical protein